MMAETPVPTDTRPAPARWKAWLQLAGAALVLLLFSEALWLWQTWPVRELLQQPSATRPAGAR